MNLIWKLLRQHISIPQFVGFFFANLFGVMIVLFGFQFYRDILPIFTGEDSFMKSNYLIISKAIGTGSTLSGRTNTFTASDIDELQSQPFVKGIGRFVSAGYRVEASMGVEGVNVLNSELFIESVPDRFVDVPLDKWRYEEGSDVVPIILPRSYLTMYNFGFAQSHSLPKISEGLVGMIDFSIFVHGAGGDRRFKGKVIGFSSRLNSILVPEQFMKWSNRQFAPDAPEAPSRMIVEVDNPTDTRVTEFMESHGYDTADNNMDAEKTTYFLKLLVTIVMAVGILISVLSFYILMLSIYLLIQKNTVKLENLLMIGFSPSQVALPYQLLTIILSGTVWVIGMGIVYATRGLYTDTLSELCPSTCSGGMLPSILAGCTLFIIVSVLNYIIIKKKIASLFFAKRK
jgi:hypothetical protein